MALKAQALVASRGSHLAVVRTDITNAFNDVSRLSALQALHDIDPQLAACQHSWLTRHTVAVTRAPGSARAILRTSRGIPQGDPLSSLTFTAVLARPLATMAEMTDASVTPLAFADDTLLVCSRDQIAPVVQQWEHLLTAHSLRLNHSKLSIWLPECADPPAELLHAFPHASFSASGIIICGLPSASSSSAHDPDALLPWGTQDFTLAHLETLKASLLKRFHALSQLTQLLGPTSSACHLALHVARINLQARFVHIWRYLSWPVLHVWAWSLQQHWTDWIATLPVSTPSTAPLQPISLPCLCATAAWASWTFGMKLSCTIYPEHLLYVIKLLH